MDSREVAMDKISISCAKECKLLNVTGVLTLDNEDRLVFYCDQCALGPPQWR
jgi:hypothetical protein